jgi:putative FmdB family regulatory protein
MPTYEYKCPAGHAFEKFYPRMNDRRHLPCPTCGKRAERVISGGAGLVFKGSGFYITDYKRAGEKKAGEGDSKPAEAKPAAESKPSGGKKKTDSGDK